MTLVFFRVSCMIENVINTHTPSLGILWTMTVSIHTWPQSDILQTLWAGRVRSVGCPFQLIWTFAFSHTATPGNVKFRFAAHVWKGRTIYGCVLHVRNGNFGQCPDLIRRTLSQVHVRKQLLNSQENLKLAIFWMLQKSKTTSWTESSPELSHLKATSSAVLKRQHEAGNGLSGL